MQFQSLFDCLHEQGMSEWQSQLDEQLREYFANIKHGDFPKWQQALNELPSITPSRIDLNQDAVVIGDTVDINNAESEQLINVLKTFMPWRKGP
ncbi:MAG: DUF1698 domain-containing protein, partial [Proteobacteria bacterium]|nr:DUF1698 domain-containing protein [Pseudomonadota bacterium]